MAAARLLTPLFWRLAEAEVPPTSTPPGVAAPDAAAALAASAFSRLSLAAICPLTARPGGLELGTRGFAGAGALEEEVEGAAGGIPGSLGFSAELDRARWIDGSRRPAPSPSCWENGSCASGTPYGRERGQGDIPPSGQSWASSRTSSRSSLQSRSGWIPGLRCPLRRPDPGSAGSPAHG